MIIRAARIEELDELQTWITGEQLDLRAGVVFVAEVDGEIVGILPLRPLWQAEPLIVKGNKSQKSRAALLLYREVEKFIQSTPGPKWFFAFTRSQAVYGWAKRLGWQRTYRGGRFYRKEL